MSGINSEYGANSARRELFARAAAPCVNSQPVSDDDWLHEPKWDGFRFQIIKDSAGVRFYSRHGAEYSDRLPRMREAFGKLPTKSAILDGELVLIDPRGAAHFYRLMSQMRTSSPDESQLMFLVFDLLHQDGVDLRGLPLSERKRDLRRLCIKSRVPFMREVQTFPNGPCYSITATSSVLRALQQTPGVTLLEWAKPQLGQDEVPGLKAHQCGAVSSVRSAPQARADGGPEDACKEARGACQSARAAAITAVKPRHRPRAEKAAGDVGARDCGPRGLTGQYCPCGRAPEARATPWARP